MFTGIVEQTGTISALTDSADGRRLTIQTSRSMDDLILGCSISVNGCCLTAVELSKDHLSVEVSHQTLRCTDLGQLRVFDQVNLERPLRFSDRLGGHLVSGHVDTVGKVVSQKAEGFSQLVTIALAKDYAPFFIEKGSVTVAGVSLTVVSISNPGENDQNFSFTVALIPQTMHVTTLGDLHVGQLVNIETDLLAKYLVRWHSLQIMPEITNESLINFDEKEPALADYVK